MAHQSHNISYSKYLNYFDKFKREELRGSNHKNFEGINILSYEFIQVIKEFADPLKQKIIESKPYTEKEYIQHMETNEELYNIAHTDNYFWHLCNAVNKGDLRLFATILKYMKRTGKNIDEYNFHYPGYGQAFLGGLCQVFDSFIGSYLLINTLVNAGYKCNEFWNYFKNTSKCNKIYNFFANSFEYSCNTISDNFQQKFKSIIGKIPRIYFHFTDDDKLEQFRNGFNKPYLPDSVSFDELKELSKEMFRLMYTAYAILSIDEKNEDEVLFIIRNIIETKLFV
jgi:hypothetical protein